jgi:hypothetical protein
METERLDLIFKLHFIGEVINTIYENNGFTCIPIEMSWRDEIIEKCHDDLENLFSAMFGDKKEGKNAMGYFKSSHGCLAFFLCTLPTHLTEKLLTYDVNEFNHITKKK